MVCMSSALSFPAIRNLACCQTNRATSRAVKYFRAASPRANQNRLAPIIIVLSTSKNAAAVGSGSAAGVAVTSAAAADAAPATCARLSGAGGGVRARPRKGTRANAEPPCDPSAGRRLPTRATLVGGTRPAARARRRDRTGQQFPISTSGGRQTPTPPVGIPEVGADPEPVEPAGAPELPGSG